MRLCMKAFESDIRAYVFATRHRTQIREVLKVRPDGFFPKRENCSFIPHQECNCLPSIVPQTATDGKLILTQNPPGEPDLFRDLFHSVMACGIEIRSKSEPDTWTYLKHCPGGGLYCQSKTWMTQCRRVSHFFFQSCHWDLSLCRPVSFVLCLPACLSMSPSAGPTSHHRYFCNPLQALMGSKYGCIHGHCVLSDVLLVQPWGRIWSSSHPSHLIVRYWIWYSYISQDFTGYRRLVLCNARGIILTLWKYIQNTCSCDKLSFILRATIALQGVIFQWLTCPLTLLIITTNYNCEQALWGKAELRGGLPVTAMTHPICPQSFLFGVFEVRRG